MRALLLTIAFTASATTAVIAGSCKAPHLTQGMPYSIARKVVLKAGFQAPTIPPYGYSKDDQKVISECFGSTKICNDYPEIDACSGAGQCKLVFEDAYNNKLSIATYGDISGHSMVTGFEIECAK